MSHSVTASDQCSLPNILHTAFTSVLCFWDQWDAIYRVFTSRILFSVDCRLPFTFPTVLLIWWLGFYRITCFPAFMHSPFIEVMHSKIILSMRIRDILIFSPISKRKAFKGGYLLVLISQVTYGVKPGSLPLQVLTSPSSCWAPSVRDIPAGTACLLFGSLISH